MGLIDDTAFVPITSSEHARSVILALRCKNRTLPLPGKSTASVLGREDDNRNSSRRRTGEPQGRVETQSQEQPGGTPIEGKSNQDSLTLDQFNDVIRQQQQAVEARREQAQERRGQEEMEATDAALLLRFQNHLRLSKEGHEYDEEGAAPSTIAKFTPSEGDTVAEIGAAEFPQRPIVRAHASRPVHAVGQPMPEKILGEKMSPVCRSGAPDEEEEGEGVRQARVASREAKRREGKSHRSSEASPIPTSAAAVDGDDVIASYPMLQEASPRTRPLDVLTLSSDTPPPMGGRNAHSEIVSAEVSGDRAVVERSDGMWSGGHVASNGGGASRALSDTSWSSSEESGELNVCDGRSDTCKPASREVDDWAGTALYGSDDDCSYSCCAPTGGVSSSSVTGNKQSSAPTVVTEKQRRVVSTNARRRREGDSVDIDALSRKHMSESVARKSISPSSGRKIGGGHHRVTDTSFGSVGGCVGYSDNKSSNKNLGRIREARALMIVRQREANRYPGELSTPPLPELTCGVGSSFSPGASSPAMPPVAVAPASSEVRHSSEEKSGRNGGVAKQKSRPGRRHAAPFNDPLNRGVGRKEWRTPTAAGGDTGNRERAMVRGSGISSRRRDDDEASAAAAVAEGECRPDSWVVQEFQARVEAARREEQAEEQEKERRLTAVAAATAGRSRQPTRRR